MRRLKWISEVELWVCSQRPCAEGQESSNGVIHFGEGVVLQGLGKTARLTLPGFINSSLISP